MKKAQLKPTSSQTFELEGRGDCDFAAVLARSYRLQEEGRTEEACDARYQGVQRLVELLPDDEEVVFEFSHRNSRAALELLQASAVDHFLAGDFEMAAALAEQLFELDPEDHPGITPLSAFCYMMLGEYELFDETMRDMADGEPEKALLGLWSSFRRTGSIPPAELQAFRSRHGELWAEFTGGDHAADDAYMADITSERPSRRAQARELWLRTEHLWLAEPQFVRALGGE